MAEPAQGSPHTALQAGRTQLAQLLIQANTHLGGPARYVLKRTQWISAWGSPTPLHGH